MTGNITYLGYGLACLAYLGSLVVGVYLWARALTGLASTLF